MSDNDATRKRHRVADPLRELVGQMREFDAVARLEQNALLVVADQIDREHEWRMEQQSYDLRKAFCRYMGGVIDDYRHGIKRKRLRK